MRLHRFFVEIPLQSGEGKLIDRPLIHQILNVLRLSVGSEVLLFNSDQQEATVAFTDVNNKEINFTILKSEKRTPEIKRKVTLACAIIKHDHFEWAAQKATEVGVNEIVPVVTDHSIKFSVPEQRLKKIMVEAAEQCGRIDVPELSEKISFRDALKKLPGTKIFFDMSAKEFGPKSLKAKEPVVLFVGPEGGWSDEEKKAAKEAGCEILSLGKNVLRSETAATVASYLAVNF